MNEDNPGILIRQGRVTGVRAGDVSVFRAIPFAQAPVGELRFAPPVPADPFGALDGTRPGPLAPQLPSRLEEAMGPLQGEQSEDCLHLTVYTPAADGARRPVIVWLHGGAWQSGGGAPPWYDASTLAERANVVVVAPNYRLAAAGWLYVPGETANVGLLDQELAIQWTRDNIEAFGGDPEAITVMGQSAGGSCAAALLARQPLFSKVIMQSASLGRGFRTADEAARLGALVLEAAGADSLAQARRLPIEALLKAQRAPAVVQALQADQIGRALFGPVIDGSIITGDMDACRAVAAPRADVLAGYTLNEMAAFPNVEISEASAHAGEAVFGAPTRAWALAAAEAGRRAWAYRFDYAPTERFGACHCIELPFVFGTFDAFAKAPMLAGADPEILTRISIRMQHEWGAFAHGLELPWAQAPHTESIQ